jgi:dTMP kinase
VYNQRKDSVPGKLIVLDGPDGCGKSTQVRLLCQWLNDQGMDSVSFRDPGDTAIGDQIRKILLSPQSRGMDTMTEFLLYMGARAQLWAERIKPALEAGKWVVMDRWISSTCAYQGHAGAYGIDRVISIAEAALERIWPDLTVILDVGIEVAAGRMERELDRMEQKGDDYHRKVREGFLRLAETNAGFVVVDARHDIDSVHAHVVREIDVLL